MSTKINWIEIPAADFARAIKFYETIFDIRLKTEELPGAPKMALFNDANGESFGCVTYGENFTPGKDGAVVYFDATSVIDKVMERITQSGGQLLTSKIELPNNIGSIVHFIDSEGNRVALHAEAQ